jgi:hypothetical protein
VSNEENEEERKKHKIPFRGVKRFLKKEKYFSKISKTLNSSCRTHFSKTRQQTRQKKREDCTRALLQGV